MRSLINLFIRHDVTILKVYEICNLHRGTFTDLCRLAQVFTVTELCSMYSVFLFSIFHLSEQNSNILIFKLWTEHTIFHCCSNKDF